MNWGEMVSRSSEPTGTPRWVRSQRSWRARRRPLLILKEPSMSGSLMRPFQPTVVRGFWMRVHEPQMNTDTTEVCGRYLAVIGPSAREREAGDRRRTSRRA